MSRKILGGGGGLLIFVYFSISEGEHRNDTSILLSFYNSHKQKQTVLGDFAGEKIKDIDCLKVQCLAFLFLMNWTNKFTVCWELLSMQKFSWHLNPYPNRTINCIYPFSKKFE